MERRMLGNLLVRCGAGENPSVFKVMELPEKREDIPIAIKSHVPVRFKHLSHPRNNQSSYV